MTLRHGFRRAAPWVLCVASVGLLVLSIVLRWLLPDTVADESRLQGTVQALGFVGVPVVGALIASRLPANPYGWVWCALGLAAGLGEVAGPLARVAGWPAWMAWLPSAWGLVGLVCLAFFVFLLFPTGSLPTPRWRWVARMVVTGGLLLVLLVPFVQDPTDPAAGTPWAVTGVAAQRLNRAAEVGIYALFLSVVAATLSLVLRFRRAGQVERRQLTWFMYAAVLNGVLIVLDLVGVPPEGLGNTALAAAGFLLLPVAVGAAMLRYRLFEIDRIVSRTVSYGLLTAGLIALYLLVVAFLRPLLEPLTGSSALAVGASTLAVAAVFNPARRRLQAAVDRRFDRARYDAAQAVAAFAARLRNQVDLDEITAGLCDTVAATVAPGRVTVWLRPADRG
jgi:hypothetical protein